VDKKGAEVGVVQSEIVTTLNQDITPLPKTHRKVSFAHRGVNILMKSQINHASR